MKNKERYTKEEMLQIRLMFEQGKSDEEMAEALGRKLTGLQYKRRRMGLHRPDAVELTKAVSHQWTEEEELFIRNFWREKSDRWMAAKLGVSLSSYKHKRQRMSETMLGPKKRMVKEWTRRKGLRQSWTFTEEQYLTEHYPWHSAAEIAKVLHRKENAIQWKAKRMGLKKAYYPGRRGYETMATNYVRMSECGNS